MPCWLIQALNFLICPDLPTTSETHCWLSIGLQCTSGYSQSPCPDNSFRFSVITIIWMPIYGKNELVIAALDDLHTITDVITTPSSMNALLGGFAKHQILLTSIFLSRANNVSKIVLGVVEQQFVVIHLMKFVFYYFTEKGKTAYYLSNSSLSGI